MGFFYMVELNLRRLTIDAIDLSYEQKELSAPVRGYLGASSIGKACERQIWYQYRWASSSVKFSGRMLRLFETGHLYEPRMIAWLKSTGATVRDPKIDIGYDYSFEALDGHFRGHMDGIISNLLEASKKTLHVVEFKTHNTKSFKQLQKHGVAISKPEHMAQMQIYMHFGGFQRAYYLAVNKNNDELYDERIHYDLGMANTIIAKAERIIYSDDAPMRITENKDSFLCRFCDFKSLCHFEIKPDRNCRTCGFSKPSANGPIWDCGKHSKPMDLDQQRAGCKDHLFEPSLIGGEQMNADIKSGNVTYKMADGSTWIDGSE